MDQDYRRRTTTPLPRPRTQPSLFKITAAVYNLLRITTLDTEPA